MANANAIVTLGTLQYFSEKEHEWVGLQIDAAIEKFGGVLKIKGTVTDAASLPAEGSETGDLYFVRAEGAAESEEYCWTGTEWEYIGTTAVDTGGMITEAELYAGADGTGTVSAPADGTILKTVYDKDAELSAQVEENKAAIEALTAADAAMGERVAAVEEQLAAEIPTSDIDALFA